MEPKVSSPSRLEEILAEWAPDKVEEDDSYTVDLSGILNNVSITTPYTYSVSPNSIYTTGTGTSPWATVNPTSASAKIQLNGEGADVEVNGWSLVAAVKRIEQRLGLFQPNPELEKEWEDLRELGEQYRQLEQYIKDKQATFGRLRAMPKPDMD
jgi:hypothetical protein